MAVATVVVGDDAHRAAPSAPQLHDLARPALLAHAQAVQQNHGVIGGRRRAVVVHVQPHAVTGEDGSLRMTIADDSRQIGKRSWRHIRWTAHRWLLIDLGAQGVSAPRCDRSYGPVVPLTRLCAIAAQQAILNFCALCSQAFPSHPSRTAPSDPDAAPNE